MVLSGLLVAFVLNNGGLSPYLCDENNNDFDKFQQYESDSDTFPHCRRNVSSGLKKAIYNQYGIVDHSRYCIDHGISLFAGGNNEQENLWPNLKDDNGQCEKQGLETELLFKLQNGQISTSEAQVILSEYVEKRKQELYGN